MEKEPFDGDPRALHQGMGSPDDSCSLEPLKLGQQAPNNDAPSEGATNSQCQISKLTTTIGGLGALSGSFQSVCADSQAKTYQLLLFQEEQRRQGPLRTDAGG